MVLNNEAFSSVSLPPAHVLFSIDAEEAQSVTE